MANCPHRLWAGVISKFLCTQRGREPRDKIVALQGHWCWLIWKALWLPLLQLLQLPLLRIMFPLFLLYGTPKAHCCCKMSFLDPLVAMPWQ